MQSKKDSDAYSSTSEGSAMITSSLSYPNSLTSLQKRWFLYIGLCACFLAGGWAYLQGAWEAVYALRWTALTAPVLIYQAWLLWRSLEYNHRPGERELFPRLGWANTLTLLRGGLFAGLTGFLASPRPETGLAWLPAGLYTVGVLIDGLDGYIARRSNQVTRLGEILDMSMDGWGMLMASMVAVQYGQVPVWYLLVGLARYLYLGGLWLRQRLGWPILELPPSMVRRPFAGLQMGFACVMLWPVFTPPATYHAAAVFSLPFLVSFMRDWLVVSATFPANFLQRLERVRLFTLRWLPLGLRLAAALILVWRLAGWLVIPDADQPYVLATAIEAPVLVLLLLGAAGRIAAIAGLVAVGFQQMMAPLTILPLALAWLYGAILYLGTGVLSVWKPEDRLIYRRAGE